MFTAYELMSVRFGPRIRRWTAGTFLILRALAEGVRVFAISIVISIVLGTGEMTSILVIVLLTLFYTYEGGMTAVIWTDVIQMILYVTGAAASFFAILDEIPGGWRHVADTAGPLGKFQMFDFYIGPWSAYFTRSYTFFAGLLGGCFLTTASHGTEQLMVQRLLSAANEKEARKALLSSWLVIFAQFTLFLLIGVCLFTLYKDNGWPTPKVTDSIYPQFIWDHLPAGFAGLITAAILAAAMSNLSAALNSLASTSVMDLVRPFFQPGRSDDVWLRYARWATVVWGAILFAVALVARSWGGVLQAGLSIASILYGALLGVFLLGRLTTSVGESAAIAGMTASLALMLYIRFRTPIAFTWYVLIGTAATCVVALLASLLLKENRPHANQN
jgi:SSS family transporter